MATTPNNSEFALAPVTDCGSVRYREYRSQDQEAFQRNGVADLYDTIGNLNLFMQCDQLSEEAFRPLPDGYSFRFCRHDELETWKRVVAEEQYVDLVTDYYNTVYASREDEFFARCQFICDADDKPVASAFIWLAYRLINTVAWMRVLPEYEGRGLGRALLTRILSDVELPIYLHTQPTSVRAIKLYSDFGFKLVCDPLIGYRKNDLDESLPHLQKVLPATDYAALRFTEANDALKKAALSSTADEF